MAQSKVVFTSEIDGSVFETEHEANAYDAEIRNKDAIDAFLDTYFPHPEGHMKDAEGNVKTDAKGNPVPKRRQDRGAIRKAIGLWEAERGAAEEPVLTEEVAQTDNA